MKEQCDKCNKEFYLSNDSFMGSIETLNKTKEYECSMFTIIIALCPDCYKLFVPPTKK